MSMAVAVAHITSGGQVQVPAAVRRRWGTRRVEIEDLGDALVIRPLAEFVVQQVRGAFRDSAETRSSVEIWAIERAEEAEREASRW